MSLIRTDVYNKLRIRSQMRKSDPALSQVDGRKLTMIGMVCLQLKVGEVRWKHKLNVAPNLCNKVILGGDRLVKRSRIPLKRDSDQLVGIVAKEDVKLPPWTAITSEGVIATGKRLEKGWYQVTPLEKYNSEEEVPLCKAVVRGQEILLCWLLTQEIKLLRSQWSKN